MGTDSPTMTPPADEPTRSVATLPGERPGDWIGPYRLLELIGEGGFGEVFLAEQKEPISRRVALKIIKPGMDSKAVIARFEAERQALALMSHPNVAKVLDAGTTPLASGVGGTAGHAGGRPYFVMEHIKGVPLTEYCDSNRLTVEQRLRLFAVVCDAVHHAHMKGIIHRDLKPSNILVSIAETGQARPVVIDFGVAKALAGRLTEQTIYTEQGVLIGTPEYMSPEQAEMSEADIDTRADVYALGVILYELLTGTVPFDRKALRAAGYGGMQRFIREHDPPHPSVRLTTLGERRADVAAARHLRPDELASTLRRELEWIPLKALRKDRAERYRSATELADDIANYLAHRPLIAGPESARYKLRKFARRNKVAVAAGAAIAASLLLATGVSVWFGVRESRQKDAALQAAQRATAIRNFLIETLQFSDPGREGRQDMLLSDAMLLGVQRLGEGALKDQPQIRAEILRTSAEILSSNGKNDAALPMAEQAAATLRALDLGDHPGVAAALDTLANVSRSVGRVTEAETLHVQALEMYQRLFAGDDPGVAAALTNLAAARQVLGRAADAEPLLVRALEMYRRLYPGDHVKVAAGLAALASVRDELGHSAQAEPLLEQSLEMYRRLFKADHPDLARAMHSLGEVRQALGRVGDAEPLFAQALDMRRRLFKNDHPDVARSMNSLAASRDALGRAGEAELLCEQGLAMRQRLYRGDHPDIAASLNILALIRQSLGRVTEAEGLCVRALEMNQRLFGRDHPEVAGSLTRLARAQIALGKPGEANASFDEAAAIFRRVHPGGSSSLARVLWRAAVARLEAGDAAGALPRAEESVAIGARFLPPDHPDLRDYRDALARCRQALSK